MKTLLKICLLFLTFIAGQAVTQHSYSFDNQFLNSAFYPLGIIDAGTTIMINLTTSGTTLDFSTSAPSLADEFQNDAGVPSFVEGCSQGDNFCTMAFKIERKGNYRYGIFAPNTPWQSFQIHITSYLTSSGGPSNPNSVITTIHKATEVFRSTTMKLIYLKPRQMLKF